MANSSFHPSGVSKWVLALAGKAKVGMAHSVSGWMQGVQVKLWNPLRMHAIPERLRGMFTTRRYTNPRLPYLTLTSTWSTYLPTHQLLTVVVHYSAMIRYEAVACISRYIRCKVNIQTFWNCSACERNTTGNLDNLDSRLTRVSSDSCTTSTKWLIHSLLKSVVISNTCLA